MLPSRHTRPFIALILFLTGFVALLLIVSNYYLLPAFDAYNTADPKGRTILSGYSRLLLALLLIILIAGLLLSVRLGKFLLPRSSKRTETKYVDAWKESANRLNNDSQSD